MVAHAVRQVLAIVNPQTSLEHLSSAEIDQVFGCGLDAVDFCWPLTGQRDWRKRRELIVEYARRAVEAGLRVRTHFWAGRRGPDGNSSADGPLGRTQGTQVALDTGELEAAIGAGVERVGVNAERDVHRGPDGTWNRGAVPYLDELYTAFFDANRVAQLSYLGFAVPRMYYRGAALPPWLRDRTPWLSAMCYDTTYAALARRLDRIREEWPEHRLSVFAGIGRSDANGLVVGHAAAHRRLVAERYAGLEEWVHYCGNDGAWRMLVAGRPDYPSVIEQVAGMLLLDRSQGVA